MTELLDPQHAGNPDAGRQARCEAQSPTHSFPAEQARVISVAEAARGIILATAEGCGTAEIMRRAEVSKPCVWRWQERFMREGVAGLVRDKTRKPGLPPLPPAVVDRVVALTLSDPPGATTHWTGRAMAAASGVSLRSVQRIWAAHGLQPHRVRRFKLSTDPAFAAKL
jgi:hypothetical protein